MCDCYVSFYSINICDIMALTSNVKRHCVTDGALNENVTRLTGIDGAVVVSTGRQLQV